MITINIDLGSAQEVKVLILYDHNMTSAATITLIGVDPTIFSEAIAWADDKIIHFLSTATTKRYWQLQITDAANPDLYIEIGEIYLGSYLELTKNYAEGFSEEIEFLMDSNKTSYGIEKSRFYNQQRLFTFDFNVMPLADVTSLKALVAAIASKSTGIFKPFFFNKDLATPNDTYLVKIVSLPVKHRTKSYYDMPLELIEAVKSV